MAFDQYYYIFITKDGRKGEQGGRAGKGVFYKILLTFI